MTAKRTDWTAREIAILLKLYKQIPIASLAERLGRSQQAIRRKWEKLSAEEKSLTRQAKTSAQ